MGILEDLAWLGLTWDGHIRRQSDHFEDYQKTVGALRAKGLLYRCFRTRSEIVDTPETPFRGTALPADEEAALLAAGKPFAWRLSIERALLVLGNRANTLRYLVETGDKGTQHQARPDRFGDVVLTRKDSPAAYHLAACHDDAAQEITHVIRGEDLVEAPHIHVLIQVLMGWPTPVYRHHKLLLDETGKRFAKRDRSLSIADLRASGHSPDDVRRMAGVA